jgi:hypothetical protein
MSRCRICVVKIGGSLLSSEGLPRRMRKWLALEMAAHLDTHFLLIVGGGKLADAVREVDETAQLDSAAAHWICVDLMDVTAQLLGAMLPEIAVVDRLQQIESCFVQPGATIFCPGDFLRLIEPRHTAAGRLVGHGRLDRRPVGDRAGSGRPGPRKVGCSPRSEVRNRGQMDRGTGGIGVRR